MTSIEPIISEFYKSPIKKGDDQSEHHISQTSLQREEADLIASLILKHKPQQTLEVGLAIAGSAVAIIAAKNTYAEGIPHVALDPYQDLFSKNAGINEVARLGLSKSLLLIERFSEDYFNECFQKGQKFDLILIDGGHSIGQAVTDAFLGDKILNKKGIIAIHDSLLFSTSASIKYLITQRGYKIISPPVFRLKTFLRMIKYSPSLGISYAIKVIPHIRTSIIALQRVD